MKIDISEIMTSPDSEAKRTAVLELSSFQSKLGDFPITEKQPVELSIANRGNRELSICGEIVLKAKIPCGRCLSDVETPVQFRIDKTLKKQGDVFVDEEMEETDYLDGFELDVEKFVYAEILVNWPMKVLCKDDCKGICRVCGKNLNEGACTCQRTEPDPRMAAIQDVFSKFKEV